jgi:leucyl aminopeptidase
MRVEVQAVSPEQVDADVLAVPLAGGNHLEGAAAQLDSLLDGLLARLAAEGELRDELGDARLVHVTGQLTSPRVAVAGIGPRERVDADALRTGAAAVAHEAREFAKRIAWVVDTSLSVPPTEQARALVDGTLLGGYEPARWKHEEPPRKLETLVLCGDGDGLAEASDRATLVAEWTNRARDLVNSPPNEAPTRSPPTSST